MDGPIIGYVKISNQPLVYPEGAIETQFATFHGFWNNTKNFEKF